jgi:GH24 family phage-related lysozyme (muramidase)
MSYKLSGFGKLALTFEEGEKLKPYKDNAGYWTVGIGHKLLPNEFNKTLKQSDIDEILNKDIFDREGELNRIIEIQLTQHQFDAVFIFSFNIGIPGFSTSSAYRYLKVPDNDLAYKSWKEWNKTTDPVTKKKVVCPGLVSRRAREVNLFVNNLTCIEGYKSFKERLHEV